MPSVLSQEAGAAAREPASLAGRPVVLMRVGRGPHLVKDSWRLQLVGTLSKEAKEVKQPEVDPVAEE